MNTFQLQMFDQLESLVKESETFYRQEFVLHGARYWVYNYRLASYTEFERPGGRECRGHMFEITNSGDAIRLASLPMQKFHNLNECPLTIGLDLSKVDTIELKADGSLISTYLHNGAVRLKSKGSLFSDQAVDASNWISTSAHQHFYNKLLEYENRGLTVNCEWCAPNNRIVIGYLEPQLTVLNARDRYTGQYIPRVDLEADFGEYLIPRVNLQGLDLNTFVHRIPSMTDNIEGYVVRIGDLWVKVKTDKYLSLHHAKDSVTNPRRLFESILDDGADDLRSMFATDVVAIAMIADMETRVVTMYNHMVSVVETFYEANKSLTRKDYAIKAQQTVDKLYFGLVMSKYIGQTIDYKAFLKSKWKDLGFADRKIGEDQ